MLDNSVKNPRKRSFWPPIMTSYQWFAPIHVAPYRDPAAENFLLENMALKLKDNRIIIRYFLLSLPIIVWTKGALSSWQFKTTRVTKMLFVSHRQRFRSIFPFGNITIEIKDNCEIIDIHNNTLN
jgi:hypothetical protein